jgi:hypothetical protein
MSYPFMTMLSDIFGRIKNSLNRAPSLLRKALLLCMNAGGQQGPQREIGLHSGVFVREASNRQKDLIL